VFEDTFSNEWYCPEKKCDQDQILVLEQRDVIVNTKKRVRKWVNPNDLTRLIYNNPHSYKPKKHDVKQAFFEYDQDSSLRRTQLVTTEDIVDRRISKLEKYRDSNDGKFPPKSNSNYKKIYNWASRTKKEYKQGGEVDDYAVQELRRIGYLQREYVYGTNRVKN